MKTTLIIPKLKHQSKEFWCEPSKIETTYDSYFGHGYELYEFGCRHLITKELAQCYRKHAQLVHDRPNDYKLFQKNYK
jgi:hypothetical protein